MAKWKSRPIFVSSTFKDMQSERDYLHKYVFPDLEDKLAKRFHHLEPIDLRWGVETVSADDQLRKEKLVLTVCLNEIERSVPFIIVLVGDRYGWIPPEENIESALKESFFKNDEKLRSVTAIEIEFGVLENETSQKNSFFYFRKPLPYHKMPKDFVRIYKDDERDNSYSKLHALKKRIKEVMPKDQIRYYEAEWDSVNNHVVGLEVWGKQVSEDLWGVLEKETKDFEPQKSNSWQDEEYQALQEFIELRSQTFIGKEELLAGLNTIFLASDSSNIHLITGADGSGKSSVFSKTIKLIEEKEDDSFILAHSCGISPKSKSIEDMLKRWIRELSKKLHLADTSSFIKSYSQLRETFHTLLELAARNTKVFLCVDSIDQFDHTAIAIQLNWLPIELPEHVQFFATLDSSTSIQLDKRSYKKYQIDLFTSKEAALMIEEILKRYRKRLNPQIVEKILQKQANNDSKKAGYSPLWLKLVVDELLFLDAKDFDRLQKFEGTDEQRLHCLLLSIVSEIDSSISGVYLRLLRRAEAAFGYEWTKNVASLIILSKNGLRDKDLKQIISSNKKLNWSDLHFAGFRNYLRSHLKQTGMLNQWNFIHYQAVPAIKNRYMKDEKEVNEFKITLAAYLWNLNKKDILRQTELGFYLLQTQDYKKFALIYSSTEINDEEQKRLTIALKDEASIRGISFFSEILANTDSIQTTIELAKRLLRLLLPQISSSKYRSALLEIVFDKLNRSLQTKENNANEELYLVFSEACLVLGKHLHEERSLDRADRVLKHCIPFLDNITDNSNVESKKNYLLAVYSQLILIGELQGQSEQIAKWKIEKTAIEEWFLKESPSSPRYIKEKVVNNRRAILTAFQNENLKEAERIAAPLVNLSESLHLGAPEVSDFAQDYAISLVFQGDYEWRKSSGVEAAVLYRKAGNILNRFITRWPDNLALIQTQAMIEQRLGDYYYSIEEIGPAKNYFDKATQGIMILLEKNPESISIQRDLSLLKERLASCLVKAGKPEKALEMILEEIKKRETIQLRYGGLLEEIAALYEQAGDCYIGSDNLSKATESYFETVTCLNQLKVIKKTNMAMLKRTKIKIELIEGSSKIGQKE